MRPEKLCQGWIPNACSSHLKKPMWISRTMRHRAAQVLRSICLESQWPAFVCLAFQVCGFGYNSRTCGTAGGIPATTVLIKAELPSRLTRAPCHAPLWGTCRLIPYHCFRVPDCMVLGFRSPKPGTKTRVVV